MFNHEKIKTLDLIEEMADEIKRLGDENKMLKIETQILRKQLFQQMTFSGKIIQNISVVPASAPEKQINLECNSCGNYDKECKGMLGGGSCISFEDKSHHGKKLKISTLGGYLWQHLGL